MRRTLPVLSLILFFAAPFPAWAAGEPAQTPTAMVRQLIDAIRTFKEEGDVPLSRTDRENNERAARLANQVLAIRAVSEQALGKQWDSLTAAQREDFVRLVQDLFEKIAYPKSSGFFGDLQVEFTGERVSADRATVKSIVRHPKEGLVSIDYKLRRVDNHWRVYDILLDEVSLAIDLRSQIQKVLREESYARLLERMRDKLKES